MNRLLRTSHNPMVTVICLSDGSRPTDALNLWFLEPISWLQDSTEAQFEALLGFYQHDAGGTLAVKYNCLQVHLGNTL
jgi:hypothetical protein